MANSEYQAPSSPPLPRQGAYNIDFDTLDESSNPFESKVRLSCSPPHAVSALSAAGGQLEPFQPGQKLSSSPPASPQVSKPANNNNIGDDGLQADTQGSPSIDTSVHSPGNIDTSVHSPGNIDELQSASNRDSTQATPKKKKIVKKTKIQSKIKAPKSVKPPEEDPSDVSAATASIAPPQQETAISEPVLVPKKQPVSRKKIQSNDVDNSTVKEDQPQAEPALGIKVANDDDPCEAASEAMASSSEIDRHFVESEDMEDSRHVKTGTRPAWKATAGASDDRSSGGQEDMRSQHSANPAPPSASEATSPATGSLTKRSSSPEATRTTKRGVNELPAVKTPPQGQTSRHPATRALEAAQADNSLQVLDSKNESSSEEAAFYDAYDYPPTAATKAKLGQKSSTEMERGSSHDDGGDSKGAVVQLVQDVGAQQVLRYSQSDWNKLKQDLELNFQASLLNKERDWSLMLAERDKKIASLEETNRKVKHTNEDMRMIVAEFEKTISQLQAEKEKTKTDSHKAVQNVESERDQAIEDLQSVETAFSDLHRRYEKSKSIIEGFKRNEEQLKQCVEDLQTKLKKSEMKLQALRSQAEDKLDKANEDIEKIKKSTRSDLVRLEAALKKAELRISGLEDSLQRKEKENLELTAICDELISKVGS